MDRKIIFLLTVFLFIWNFAFCQSHKNQDLYDLIGLEINSSEVKKYINNSGEYKIRKYTEKLDDYLYEDSGIQFRVNKDGIIVSIFCNNWKQSRYTGELPFGLTFSNQMAEIENKIGKGTIIMESGFYGRTLLWKIQDLYKVGMEVELPRSETDTLRIVYMVFSKIEKE